MDQFINHTLHPSAFRTSAEQQGEKFSFINNYQCNTDICQSFLSGVDLPVFFAKKSQNTIINMAKYLEEGLNAWIYTFGG